MLKLEASVEFFLLYYSSKNFIKFLWSYQNSFELIFPHAALSSYCRKFFILICAFICFIKNSSYCSSSLSTKYNFLSSNPGKDFVLIPLRRQVMSVDLATYCHLVPGKLPQIPYYWVVWWSNPALPIFFPTVDLNGQWEAFFPEVPVKH